VLQLDGGAFLRPERLLDLSIDQLRAAGLSRQKARYVKGMAEFVAGGKVEIERLHEMSDSEICAQLVRMTGVGIWTAQMFLIFRLGRTDVLPATDLGVRKGVQLAYRLRRMPDAERVEKIGGRWAPFRSVASWYLWRLLDVEAARKKNANGR
jgi:DNA-3-methyladenine glycosylase II